MTTDFKKDLANGESLKKNKICKKRSKSGKREKGKSKKLKLNVTTTAKKEEIDYEPAVNKNDNKSVTNESKDVNENIPLEMVDNHDIINESLVQKIHCGNDIFISETAYANAQNSAAKYADNDVKSKTTFIREVAVSIIGVEDLKRCSVKGRKCGRTGSIKPKLDPKKYGAVLGIVEHYLRTEKNCDPIQITEELKSVAPCIAAKMWDLCRPPRKNCKTSVNKKSNPEKTINQTAENLEEVENTLSEIDNCSDNSQSSDLTNNVSTESESEDQ